MFKKSLFVLIVSLPIFFLTVKITTDAIHRQKLDNERKQAKIILENVLDRFNLFLELPYSIGTVGADYFARGPLDKMDYSPFRRLLEHNPEIFGLNVLDAEGKIIRAWPYDENAAALGKTTQNIEHIRRAYERGQDHWLSPPFNLYQGERGFVFYLPIIENNKLKGWFAPVVNTQTFSSKFQLHELLQAYELVIQDTDSESLYFSTAMVPKEQKVLETANLNFYNRSLNFYCWKKPMLLPRPMSGSAIFGISAVLSLLSLFVFGLVEQKRKARAQLRDIGVLLRMTYQEAQTKLINLHNKLSSSKSEAIDYLNNLIEQIDLLQTMTWDEQANHEEVVPLLPLMENQLRYFNDVIENKNLKVLRTDHSPHALNVRGHAGLLQNALNIIFAHAMILARAGGEIHMELTQSRDEQSALVNLSIQTTQDTPTDGGLERRIEVARRALQINDGSLFLQGVHDGSIIRIQLPQARA